MIIREEIRRLAKKTYEDRLVVSIPAIESAILEGVKLVLEREPSSALIQAAEDRMIEGAEYIAENSIQYALWKEVYRAMTQELLKELNGKP